MEYTVVKGDCLWNIAEKYLGSGLRWTEIADSNGISRSKPIIYPGQVLTINKGGIIFPSYFNKGTSEQVPSIDYFGLQAGTDNTIFAAWSWDRDNTENYKTMWYYDTGNGIWFVGNDSTTEYKQSVYSAPSNAKRVKFKVKAIAKTHKVNNVDTVYWTSSWSSEKIYDFKDSPPIAPSSPPTISIEKYLLTAELDNLDLNADGIEFEVIQNDLTSFAGGIIQIIKNHASFSCSVNAGGKYKVRCRAVKGVTFKKISGSTSFIQVGFNINTQYSSWTDYSSNVETIPATPAGITEIRANSETSIYLEWSKVRSASSYDIQYTTNREYFDGSDQVATITGIETTSYIKNGLDIGYEYFFRVRAVNNKGYSSWSGIKSIILGKKPSAPTTWSSTTTCVSGELLTLYWVHNSEDGSGITFSELELDINGEKITNTIVGGLEGKDTKGSYSINTNYNEGSKILWRVRTAGVTKVYSDWSIQRTVDIYARPTLVMEVTNSEGEALETLTSFPFYISGTPGPDTQEPLGYHVSIMANESYETVDNVGNVKIVNEGEEVYSKNFDADKKLLIELSASNIDLENNISYTIVCNVSMNSGLSAEAISQFIVSWANEQVIPSAEIAIDSSNLASYIHPYCLRYPITYYVVEYNDSSNEWIKTDTTIDETEGSMVDDAITTTNEQVYAKSDGTYFTVVKNTEGEIMPGVTLSVYRKEFDGSFTEIVTGLDNSLNTFVTDPHPALDFARYRIVATIQETGAVSYYDIPNYPIGEKSVVIQWNETWSSFDAETEDELEDQPWNGSLLKLPYNIDVSDSNSSDITMVNYIGRKHPVSYYGTQLGETSNWSVEIPKDDVETLYALRRLSKWMGDVYVREPSGSGYWASVSVSISQKHCELTIPVKFTITRVEGGI